jgi:hypothetical protein
VFRASLRSLFLLVTFHAAASAGAADIDSVTFDLTLANVSKGSDTFAIEIRVVGDGFNNGVLQRPALLSNVTFKEDGDDLVIEDDFNSLAALLAAYPLGSYEVRVNNGNVRTTLSYNNTMQPPVPNPDISHPDGGQVLPPEQALTVEFTNCSICNQIGDSIVAELDQIDDMGNRVLVDDEDLAPSAETWTPEDGMGGDLLLPQLTDFFVTITNETLRQTSVFVTGEGNDDDDIALFSSFVRQSDEVDFSTGFDTPEGHVCLSANHSMPPVGCTIVNDTLLQVLDTTGAYMTTVNGNDITYNVIVAGNGTLSGTASGFDVSSPIKGKLKGKDGDSSQKVSFTLDNENIPAKVKISINELFSIPGNTQSSTQKNSGTIGGVKVDPDGIPVNGALTQMPLGWLVEFDIDDSDEISNGSLTLEGGRLFTLTGSNKFKFTTGESTLKLQSADKGVRIDLKKVVFDDGVSPVATDGGDLSQKILGQSHKAVIPPAP